MLLAALLAVSLSAPPLSLQATDGRTVSLEALRGSPVLLVFYRGHW